MRGVQRLRYRVAARRDLLGIGFREGGLPLLHGLPEVIIDDAEFWYIDLDPFGLGIEAQHLPAGVAGSSSAAGGSKPFGRYRASC